MEEVFSVAKFMESKFPRPIRKSYDGSARSLRISTNSGKLGATSNTTVFAIKYGKKSGSGVLVAADRRVSTGNFSITSDEYDKIDPLTDHSVITYTGSLNAAESLASDMQSICRAFEKVYSEELSPDGQASYLAGLVKEAFYCYIEDDGFGIVEPILATYDIERREPRIFYVFGNGLFWEEKNLAGNGCGWDVASGLINDNLRSGLLDKNSTIDLALRALLQSGKSSAGVSDLRVTLPNIITIDKTGIKIVPDSKLESMRDSLLTEGSGV